MEKVPCDSDERSGGSISGRLGHIAHGSDDTRLDAPFCHHQITVKTIYHVSQLTLVAQLRCRKNPFNHHRTRWIFQRYQAFAQNTGRADNRLIRRQRFAQ